MLCLGNIEPTDRGLLYHRHDTPQESNAVLQPAYTIEGATEARLVTAPRCNVASTPCVASPIQVGTAERI